MSRAGRAVTLVFALGAACSACSGDPGSVTVRVDARATVGAISSLELTLFDDLGGVVVTSAPVPAGFAVPDSVTFGVGAASGHFVARVRARDALGASIGQARGDVALTQGGRADLAVLLDPDDFRVNATEGEVHLVGAAVSAGHQVAVAADGSFLVAWMSGCGSAGCKLSARRFDAAARPAKAGDLELAGAFADSPAVAAGAAGYVVTWIGPPVDTANDDEMYAVVLGLDGTPVHAPVVLTTSTFNPGHQDPVAAALADGSYVVMWQEPNALNVQVMAAHVATDGTPVMSGGFWQVPMAVGRTFFVEPDIVLFRQNGYLALAGLGFDARLGVWAPWLAQVSTTPLSATGGNAIINVTGGAFASAPHIARTAADGTALVWMADDGRGKRRIRLRRHDYLSVAVGTETTVADQAATAEPVPVIAVRPSDGAIGVAWTECGNTCQIRFRLLHPDGLPCGESVAVATAVAGDERDPSLRATGDHFVAVWQSGSGEIRARVLYPPLDRADGLIGARCDVVPCAPDLACLREGVVPLCHTPCTLADGLPCDGGGVCQAGVCRFD